MTPIDAAAAGFDPAALSDAIAFAKAHESGMDRDISAALAGGHFSEPLPDGEIIGLTRPRGDPSGMILRRGLRVVEWGPVDAPDMTFSVAKSYLSILAGLAVADGLINVAEPCRKTVPDLFEAEQNRDITWMHLLTNSSEWQGTLWGKEDRIDHYRSLGTAPGAISKKGTPRPLQAPGTYWEYNDVRVNVLSYGLMRAFDRPLPEVLRERIMDPIGASSEWEWHGYGAHSTVKINGRSMESVSGGAHWGGGMFIPTTDHARVGQLMAQRGRWGDRQLLPESWVDACTTPCPLNSSYGYLWWLNGDGAHMPSAPRTSFFALGVGRSMIWIEPDLDLVCVVRWIDRDSCDGFCARVMAALA
ncbi:MAG: serine hydrolase domain-containing protein [Paracoccaceae bacterium]